jgi:hypothetical protein
MNDTTIAVASWAFYLLGVVTAAVFLVTYLVGIRFWRPRPPGERPGTVRARRFILALTCALSLRYVTGLAQLISTGGHPADAPPALLGSFLGVLVQVYLLVLLVQQRREDKVEVVRR